MKKSKNLARIFVKGGIVTPGQLLKILSVARKIGNESIHFGSKQDILFPVEKSELGFVAGELKRFDVKLVLEEDRENIGQNITSSYVSSDIMPSTPWLTSGTYLTILNTFNYTPKLRINIVDPAQNLVPVIFGEINFIASQKENYWHLFIRIQSSHIEFKWPGLVYSKDIPDLSKTIEELVVKSSICDSNKIIKHITASNNYHFLQTNETAEVNHNFFPYYEGINPMMDKEKFWIGFYWKNNTYDIPFLEKIAAICLKNNLSRICITPWKSFLVKDIRKENILKWQEIIGHFGINLRHSSFDLNWHIPLLSNSAYRLKNYISREFNKIDIRTYGLTFAIGNNIEEQFASIAIIQQPLLKMGNVGLLKKYSIYHAKNFDVNSGEYILFTTVYEKKDIVTQLVLLSREYYLKISIPKIKVAVKSKVKQQTNSHKIFQCNDCLTVYDPEYGDLFSGIEPGTKFIDLPTDYCCATCSAEKINFKEITLEKSLKNEFQL